MANIIKVKISCLIKIDFHFCIQQLLRDMCKMIFRLLLNLFLNLKQFVLTLCGLMTSFTSAQSPSNPQVFFPSPFYFYNPATHPTQKIATSKGKPTTSTLEVTYHDHPQSTLIGSHVIFLTTCMKELKGNFQIYQS